MHYSNSADAYWTLRDTPNWPSVMVGNQRMWFQNAERTAVQYPGVKAPFKHQITVVDFLLRNPRAYDLSDMGVGKTYAALWAARHLLLRGVVQWVLIVSPLSTMRPVWGEALRSAGEKYAVLHGSKRQRIEQINRAAPWMVVNHDGLEVVAKELPLTSSFALIYDELSAYKNPRSKRSKIAQEVARVATWVVGLTGTPDANSPVDAYGLARVVTPNTVPKFFTPFKASVLRQVSLWKWVPLPNAPEIVAKALQPSIRFSLDSVHDLPPVTYSLRFLKMSDKQNKAYMQLLNTFMFQSNGQTTIALNSAVQITKLVQVSCGITYDDQGAVHQIDPEHRAKQIYDLLSAPDMPQAKAIIFAPFKHLADYLVGYLANNGLDVAQVNGDVSVKRREEIFAAFQRTEKIRFIVADPRCMSHGLTLTAARIILWACPIYDNEVFLQANARPVRPGQHFPVEIIQCFGTREEREMYSQLRAKSGNMQLVLDLVRQRDD